MPAVGTGLGSPKAALCSHLWQDEFLFPVPWKPDLTAYLRLNRVVLFLQIILQKRGVMRSAKPAWFQSFFSSCYSFETAAVAIEKSHLQKQREKWGVKKNLKLQVFWGFQKDHDFIVYPVSNPHSVCSCNFSKCIEGNAPSRNRSSHLPKLPLALLCTSGTGAFGHPKPRAKGFRKALERSSCVSSGTSALHPLHFPHPSVDAFGQAPHTLPSAECVSSGVYCCSSNCPLEGEKSELPQISSSCFFFQENNLRIAWKHAILVYVQIWLLTFVLIVSQGAKSCVHYGRKDGAEVTTITWLMVVTDGRIISHPSFHRDPDLNH